MRHRFQMERQVVRWQTKRSRNLSGDHAFLTVDVTTGTSSIVELHPNINCVQVYINGLRIYDFVRTSDTVVTLGAALTAGQTILIYNSEATDSVSHTHPANVVSFDPTGTASGAAHVQAVGVELVNISASLLALLPASLPENNGPRRFA